MHWLSRGNVLQAIRRMELISNRPVLQDQAGDSAEFPGVGRYKDEGPRQTLPRQESIVRPDGLTLRFKQSTHSCGLTSGVGVERYLPDRRQQQFDLAPLPGWLRAFLDPVYSS